MVPEAPQLFTNQKYDVDLTPVRNETGRQFFTVNVAYISRDNQATSIQKSKLRKTVEKPEDERLPPLDLLLNPERVSEVIAFTDSAYLIKYVNKDHSTCSYTLHFSTHTGKCISAVMWEGKEKYNELFSNATKSR